MGALFNSNFARLFTVLALLLLLAPPVSAQDRVYTVEVLGPFTAKGINQLGGAAGWFGSPTRPVAFSDASGLRIQFMPRIAAAGVAEDLNDLGQVVGAMSTSIVGLEPTVATRWTDRIPQLLGVLGAGKISEANGINSAGHVTGYSSDGSFDGTSAFLFTDADGMVDITPDVHRAFGKDINDSDQVTGYMLAEGGNRAFRWSAADGLENLGTVDGFTHSFGFAINLSGQVAGHVQSAGGNVSRIARFTDGIGMEDLGGVGETNLAWGINSLGEVVGEGRPTSGLLRAFLYTDGDGLQDLNELLDPAFANWFVLAAYDINDASQIVANAINNDTGKIRSIRLTPVP